MARIGIDAHAIGGRLTGNETYISKLIEALVGLGSNHEFVLFFTEDDSRQDMLRRFPGMTTLIVSPANPLVRIPVVMPWLVRRYGIDLLHVQYAGPPFPQAPLVTSIHDISFETHPEFFSRKEELQFKITFRMTACRAARVLTISQHSKLDLVEIYGLPEEKVVVTPLAAGPEFVPPVSADAYEELMVHYGIDEGYILAVGNLQPRKNMVRLISAYTRLRDVRPDIEHKLVIVGQESWRHDPILDFMNKSRWAADIIHTGYVPGPDLPGLYGRADLFVYPSIYEGFGLPPLEAMACGTPVIVSNRSALPEVVGEAGLLIDPFDVEDLAASMGAMLLNPELARHYARAGKDRAAQFSWDRCASQTLTVYEEILSGGIA